MSVIINKGLNVPITGQPLQTISNGPSISRVALVADDYVGMRPTLLVRPGDEVKLGQPVFEDKKNPGVIYVSPTSGEVESINRGEKRKFESMIFKVKGDSEETFASYSDLGALSEEEARTNLIQSGLWTSLRTRPYSKVPQIDGTANSIFVTCVDTNPLAAEPELVIKENESLFVSGLTVLSKINDGPVHVCTRADSRVPGKNVPGVSFQQFEGPHPSGNVGTHIHFVDPVGAEKTVWHINYQDVIAIGHLFTTGRLMVDRIVSVAGPMVQKPQLFRTRVGADLSELCAGNTTGDKFRIISGSVLHGRTSADPVGFLGRFHLQVSVLEEGTKREFMGWQKPGLNKFSITGIYLGSWLKSKKFKMNTNINGGHRAMVPIGTYERVMPLDIMPTHLLRALIVEDTEQAQMLGVLELDEEDLALCTYVCTGKYDYGSILRNNLTRIEKEG